MDGEYFFQTDKDHPAQTTDETAAPQDPLRSLEQNAKGYRGQKSKHKGLQIVHHGRPPQVHTFNAKTSPMATDMANRAASAIRLLPLSRSPAM